MEINKYLLIKSHVSNCQSVYCYCKGFRGERRQVIDSRRNNVDMKIYNSVQVNNILNFADGSRYDGEFFQNDLHGEGTYIWPDNRVYKGQWKNNKMHGNGQMIWQDSRKYNGEYEEDKKHGKGVFVWSDGRKFIGTWKQGKLHGVGIYYLQNKEAKVGEWNEGIRIKWFEQNEVDQLIEEQKIKREDLFLQN
ncbi:unnamed protein product [Paramecium sonneborni]|uniref:MORN repeat protein n=1 Tax=Paramecium sonneborni TaxID=65129 RepID=A0A8S1RQJ5_9CILI|nr:unnamed protein product [Paramecium sonneborni]